MTVVTRTPALPHHSSCCWREVGLHKPAGLQQQQQAQ